MSSYTAPTLLDDIFKKYHDEIAFVYRQPFYRQIWTYADTRARIEQMTILLQSKGLGQGDKIAICGPNSPWWLTVYLSCASMGVVVVPLDFNSTNEFIDKIMVKTKAKILFKSVYKVYDCSTEIILLEDLAHLLSNATGHLTKLPLLKPEDTLEIVFTSGSTGSPKGVVLTHGNIMSNVENFLEAWASDERQVDLSMVPLSHMLEQTAGFWAPFKLGCSTVYIASLRPTEIARAIREEGVTFIVTVPAFLQLLRRRVSSQIDQSVIGQTITSLAAILPFGVRRVVSWPIRRQLGHKLQYLAVGGAALPVEVETFWSNLGLYIIQGYGLTETSPLATYSNKKYHRPQSVGKGLPNQEIKLNSSGELLLRGPHIFKGYLDNDVGTSQILDNEGWLHTGDIAEIDQDGFVYLKGRVKNMLLSSNGLNIFPEDIEAKILNYRDIRDVVVLMDNRGDESKLTAVILTDRDESFVRATLEEVNRTLASHQVLQNHIIWPDTDFPRTPTRKVRRNIIQEAVDSRKTDAPFIPSQDASEVQSILRQVSGASISIESGMTLMSDLAIDSIKRLELVTLIEEKLLVAIDESDITSTTTVKQLESMVDKTRQEQAKGKIHPKTVRGLTNNLFILFIQSTCQAAILWFVSRFQKLEVVGNTPVGPVIYVANHTSHLDALTFLRAAGFTGRYKLAVAAAADYFFKGRLRALLSRSVVHAIPIERDGSVRESLERVGHELSNNRSVVVFPEGSRSIDGKPKLFKPGVGLLAAILQIPVVPVKLEGNYAILPKGSSWPKRGKTRMVIGEPRIYSVSQTPDEVAVDLQNAVEAL